MARFGTAGGTFNDPRMHQKFGNNAKVGAAGERGYARLLDSSGISSLYEVYGSLNIPDSSRSNQRYQSDVDAAVANGNTLVLIDVKKWASGYMYWSIMGFPFKGIMPLMNNGRWKLSANMAAALARYRSALPGVNVQAMVVFVPTNKTGAMPVSVGLLFWPGGIRSYLSGDSVYRLKKILGKSEAVSPKIKSILGRMSRT